MAKLPVKFNFFRFYNAMIATHTEKKGEFDLTFWI